MKKSFNSICNKQLIINQDFIKAPDCNKLIFLNYKSGNWIELDEIGYSMAKNISGSTIKAYLTEVAKENETQYSYVAKIYNESIEAMLKVGFLIVADNNGNEDKKKKKLPKETKSSFEQIWIHIIDTCNLSCPYCYFRARNVLDEGGIKNIDIGLLKKFLNQIPLWKRKNIVISGGEPFLNKELVTILRLLKERLRFPSVKIITNGTVGHNIYSQVFPYINGIQFSLDGIKKETHEKNRGAGSFEKTIMGIKKSVSLGFKNIIISFAVTEENIDDLLDFPAFAKDLGIHSVHINRIIRTGKNMNKAIGGYFDSFDKNYKVFLKKVAELKEDGYSISVSNSFEITQKIKIGGKVVSCGVGKTIISIVPNGNIYPCPSLHYDAYRIGTLNDKLNSIIKEGVSFNRQHNVESKKTDCYSCKYKYFCGGGCRAEALAEGSINGSMDRCKNIYSDIISGICYSEPFI